MEVLTDHGSDFVSAFMRDVYKFLGISHIKTAHIVRNQMDVSKDLTTTSQIEAVSSFLRPVTKKYARSFLSRGLAGYYRG